MTVFIPTGCEHSWSIESWIHSKKRNRLGQVTVERLVRAHANLALEARLESSENLTLPWDLEMIIDDAAAVADDAEGVAMDAGNLQDDEAEVVDSADEASDLDGE